MSTLSKSKNCLNQPNNISSQASTSSGSLYNKSCSEDPNSLSLSPKLRLTLDNSSISLRIYCPGRLYHHL